MSAVCLVAGAVAAVLMGDGFTLSWTHSVEKVEWQEDYRVIDGRLTLETARVKGSGAGMEPPDGAVRRDGWWEYHPRRSLDRLRLARSDAAGDYRLCRAGACVPLTDLVRGATAATVEIFACGSE
jgi:hypothetical protein